MKRQLFTPKIKRVLQILILFLFIFSGWQRFSTATRKPSSNTSKIVEISDTELLAVAESLRITKSKGMTNANEIRLAKLGHDLFFDKGFSADGEVACASCHKPSQSFTDGLATSKGLGEGNFNAPTLVNMRYSHWFFWDGRADSLEAQARGPLEHPREHGFTRLKVARRLEQFYKKPYEEIFGPLPRNLPEAEPLTTTIMTPFISDEIAAYALATLGDSSLQKMILGSANKQKIQPIEVVKNLSAFGTIEPAVPPISKGEPSSNQTATQQDDVDKIFVNFAKALAAFEKTIEASDSPFDEFARHLVATKNSTLSFNPGFQAKELRGLKLFVGRGQCIICHNGPTLSDQQFHNIGLAPIDSKSLHLGRAQGMITAKADPFNCRGKYLASKKPTESCLELGYLESENVDSVGAFKTPTLRQLGDSAPYGHDGRFATLAAVLRHYNSLGQPPSVGRTEATLQPLGLNEKDLDDLETFLMSLNGKVSYLQR